MALGRQHHVQGLQVAVDLLILVHVLQAVQDLADDVDDGLLGELARDGLQHRGQVAGVHPLHDEVELVDPVLGPLVRLVDADDVLLALAGHILERNLC